MKVKKCPYCSSTNLREEEKMIVCEKCGFHTLPLYTNLSEDYENNPITPFDRIMKAQPILLKVLKVLDKNTNQWWFPLIMNLYPKGIVYPIGDENNWKWAFSSYVVIPLDLREQYPIPDRPGEYYEYQLDLQNTAYCNTYLEAIDKFKK